METRVDSLAAVVEKTEQVVADAKAKDITNAETSKPYYIAKAELDRLKRFRDVLAMRTWQEKVEVNMPVTKIVEIVETAEASRASRSPQ